MGLLGSLGLKKILEEEAQVVSNFSSKMNFIDDENIKNMAIYHGTPFLCGDVQCFIKEPHTLSFKNLDLVEQTRRRIVTRGYKRLASADNKNATVSELITEKRNSELGFASAHYIPREIDGVYYVLSPKTLKGVDSISYYNMCINESFKNDPLDDSICRLLSAINGDAVPVYGNSIKDLLKLKDRCLEIMTAECFDELIASKIVSIFDFADDEHDENLMLLRDYGSYKYEHIFILDKESNPFSYRLAKEVPFYQVKQDLASKPITSPYVGTKVIKNDELFSQKLAGVCRLLKTGKLDSKFYSLIEKLSNLSFDQYAEEIKTEFDIMVDKNMLDIYKYGQGGAKYICEILG